MNSAFITRVPRALLLVVLTLGSTLSQPVFAQWWADDAKPVDSSYWWTLSQTISPQQLRDALTDVEQHQLRFETNFQSLAGELPSSITVYIDGATSPELIPVWRAFAAFAHRFEDWDAWDSEAPISLGVQGISAAGATSILNAAASLNSAERDLKSRIWPHAQEFNEIVREAGRALSSIEDAQQLVDQGDFSTLSRITGRPAEDLQRLQSSAIRSPMVEAALPLVEGLSRDLSIKDWQSLRSYLLTEVATGILVRDMETAGSGTL